MNLSDQILAQYGALLLDMNLAYALACTWALVHMIKQSPWIKSARRRQDQVWRTRVVGVIAGFVLVMFFKRGDDIAMTANLAVLVAIANPFIYKLLMFVVGRLFPQVDALLTNDKPKK